jgi:hypothetical protein
VKDGMSSSIRLFPEIKSEDLETVHKWKAGKLLEQLHGYELQDVCISVKARVFFFLESTPQKCLQ